MLSDPLRDERDAQAGRWWSTVEATERREAAEAAGVPSEQLGFETLAFRSWESQSPQLRAALASLQIEPTHPARYKVNDVLLQPDSMAAHGANALQEVRVVRVAWIPARTNGHWRYEVADNLSRSNVDEDDLHPLGTEGDAAVRRLRDPAAERRAKEASELRRDIHRDQVRRALDRAVKRAEEAGAADTAWRLRNVLNKLGRGVGPKRAAAAAAGADARIQRELKKTGRVALSPAQGPSR